MKPTERLLLKNARIITNNGDRFGKLANEPVDVRLDNTLIAEVKRNLTSASGERSIDLKGLVLLPGFIDLHTHLRDFDQAEVEDIASGTQAAAAGGFTTVMAMANTSPPIDNVLALENAIKRIESSARVEVLQAATVTKGLSGKELTNMVEMAEHGAAAFSDDGHPITNLSVLRRALEYARLANRLVISHPEDKDLSSGGSMNESPQATRLGLGGIPVAAEAACVAREIEVARQTRGWLHFAHLSCAPAISLVRRAKQEGINVSADVTPHHLILTDEDVQGYDARFKTNPPLRSRKDQEALIEGLADGTIDAIATDHSPHSLKSKTGTFDQCAFGVIGLETAFPLVYERLVKTNLLSFEHLIALMTTGPASVLALPEPSIKLGQPANLVAVSLSEQWHYDVNSSFSKSRNSPFHGKSLSSRIVMTFFKGQIVYQKSKEPVLGMTKG